MVPGEWLADTVAGGRDSAEAFAADEHGGDFPGGHYLNQSWVPAGGQVLLGMGIHGRFLWVDRASRVVMAVLSTWPTSLDPGRARAVLEAFSETARQLSSS